MGRDSRHDLIDLVSIARVNDGDVRHAPEYGNILSGLVARSVAGRQAGEGAHDLDIEVFLSNRHADEVVGPTCGEHRVCRGEGYKALPCYAGGSADQELLRHSHLVEAIR